MLCKTRGVPLPQRRLELTKSFQNYNNTKTTTITAFSPRGVKKRRSSKDEESCSCALLRGPTALDYMQDVTGDGGGLSQYYSSSGARPRPTQARAACCRCAPRRHFMLKAFRGSAQRRAFTFSPGAKEASESIYNSKGSVHPHAPEGPRHQ